MQLGQCIRKGERIVMATRISRQTLERLPQYLSHLESLQGVRNISATAIAAALNLNQVQVRKDLAMVSSSGRPKVGYLRERLIGEIKAFLGYDSTDKAVIVGAGKLGRALMGYAGFRDYGLYIQAAFDKRSDRTGEDENGRPILPLEALRETCLHMNVRIGIITVPAQEAQQVCDQLIDAGVLAIWNFAPVRLVVPQDILVQNENMASSLAILSNHLKQQMAGATGN
jgi:redox-sensing transcriptional repressor